MLRVGSTSYDRSKGLRIPQVEGFTTILVLTETFKGPNSFPELGPYSLRTPEGHLVENRYQFSKVYASTPAVEVPVSSRKGSPVAWSYPATEFTDDEGHILPAYWEWRRKGMTSQLPVRAPVGWSRLGKCLYAVDGLYSVPDYVSEFPPEQRLTYLQSRSVIYEKQYRRAAKRHPRFRELVERLEGGESLLIAEVDGPRPEAAAYYLRTYHIDTSLGHVEVTPETLDVFLNDPLKPYGHGYCLSRMLLEATALAV